MSGGYSIFSERPGAAARPLTVVVADDQALVRGGFRLILKAAGIDVAAEAADGAQAVAAVRAHRPDVVLMDIRMPVMDGIEATRQILATYQDSAASDQEPPASPAPPPGTSAVPGSNLSPRADPDSARQPPAEALRSASCCYQADAPRIIILTTFDLDEYVYAALRAGASGFLLKDVTPEHLVSAIHLVRTGDALLAPSITRRLVERFAPAPPGAGVPGLAAGAAGAVSPAGTTATGAGGAFPSSRATGAGGATPPGGASGDSGPDAPGPAGGGVRRPGVPAGETAALTPRELEVLGLLARGMSNAEIATSLFLSEATVKTHVARILTKLGLRDRVQAVVLAYETGLISPGT